jgi:pre-mRNA cleavage complex 2 protein Pcf11
MSLFQILSIQSPPKVKLTGFYLLDSIVKNVKGSYVSHFQRNLADLFLSTFNVADANMQRALLHLFDTWRVVFAQSALGGDPVQVASS